MSGVSIMDTHTFIVCSGYVWPPVHSGHPTFSLFVLECVWQHAHSGHHSICGVSTIKCKNNLGPMRNQCRKLKRGKACEVKEIHTPRMS